MGKSLTLDELRKQIDDQYGPFTLDLGKGRVVKMLPVLRLPRDKRERIGGMLAEIGKVDSGDLNAVVDQLAELVRLSCETPEQGDWLMAELGDDGQAVQYVFEQYQEATGLGDPKRSAS
jgi:hypothetical protein